MEESINQRIREALQKKSISVTQLSKEIKTAQTTLNRQLNGDSQLSALTVESILAYFPDISADWLISGKGSMLKSEQIPSIKERLVYFLKEQSIETREFCDSINMSLPYFSEMKKALPERYIKSIMDKYPQLSIGWLMSGEGSMINSDHSETPEQVDFAATNIKIGTPIRYFPSVSGSMGGVEFLDNPDELSTDIVLPGFSECKFAVNAYGDSMHPVIKNGQIVIMMPWIERFIDWGHIYMVITKSGYRAIKYLKPSTKEGCITCESENKENNPPFDVEMEDIHKLYLVKGWICRDAI